MSMTGFGKSSAQTSTVLVDVELRAVNSRFLDLNIKAPREYAEFEADIRSLLQSKLHRGRIEAFVQRTVIGAGSNAVAFNRVVFDEYWKHYTAIAIEQNCFTDTFRSSAIQQILSRRDVLDAGSGLTDIDEEKASYLKAFSEAADMLITMRQREGASLARDFEERIKLLRLITSQISTMSIDMVDAYRTRLEERLKSVNAGEYFDENRLIAEATLLADRVDITEELVRISSHCEQWDSIFFEAPQGRKLEFIIQELGREFNTIASKTQKGEVQALVVEAKSALEKMREQAANVE